MKKIDQYIASMGFTLEPDEVSIVCPECGQRLMALKKAGLTITETIEFLTNLAPNPMFCRQCSEVGENKPKDEELH